MKKIIVIGLFAALIGMTMPGLANAALTQSQIDSILSLLNSFGADSATVANVRASLTGGTPTVPTTPGLLVSCTFTRALAPGSDGADVNCLQRFLNSAGHIVSATGAGSPGSESNYYGTRTQAAVQAWQVARGVPFGAYGGYFGPASQASYVAHLAAGGTTPPIGPMGPTGPTGLTGTANIDAITDLSQYSGEDVGEGQSDVVVLGREIEMDNTGNARLQQVRVKFDHAGGTEVAASSTRLQDYASKVSIMLNGTEVGSSAAVDFSRDSSGVYSRTILLNASAILNSGAKNNLLIAVSALSNLDSGDVTEEWDVNIENIRYVDATGAIITDSTTGVIEIAETFSFDSLATSNDIELKLNVTSSNPIATSVEVSTAADTKDHTLIAFTLKAQGEKIWIDELPVLLTVSSPTGLAEVSDIVAKASLKLGSATFSDTLPAACDTAITCTITFDDIDTWIEKDQLANASVVIDIQELTGLEFLEASSVKADITATELDAAIAEDTNGNTISTSSPDRRTGVVTGELQTLYSEGIHVTNFLAVITPATSGANSDGVEETYKITYTVTAFGETFYMDKSVVQTTATTEGLEYAMIEGTSAATAGTETASSITSTNATTVGARFELPEGTPRTFSATINYTTDDGFFKVRITDVGYYAASSGGTATYYTPVPTQNYETADALVKIPT